MNTGPLLFKNAKKIIPGGTQLISKNPDKILPEFWPAYFIKAKGCEIWDLDGTKYLDMTHMSVGTCPLGYADDDVNNSVIETIKNGNMSTLLSKEEVELAKLLCEIHPWANSVRYTKSGGEAMAMAVRIARAHTGKDKILICGYHGWHDWYLSANLLGINTLKGHLMSELKPLGVPKALKGTVYPFEYNNINSLISLIEKYKKEICAIVIEPIRNVYPAKYFLETIRKISFDLKIILIFDEITSGWRLNLGGSHLHFNINPDIAILGKGMSNGFPLAAIIGKKKIMQVVEKTFISSTYWTESIGPVAALATIKKMKDNNVPQHLINCGEKVQKIWYNVAIKHNIDIDITGIYPLSRFTFKYPNADDLRKLFTKLMLKHGILAMNVFYPTFAHKQQHLNYYSESINKVFGQISKEIR